MKVNSSDLEAALKVTHVTVGSASDISSHYTFRERGGRLEVLSYDGRTFSSCLVPNVTPDDGATFTVEARRIHMMLESVGANQSLEVSVADSEVVVKGPRGKVTFSSLDPAMFPYWDDVLSGAKTTATIQADRLSAAFNHAKQFIYDQEGKAPHLCLAEFRKGVLHSTDQMAVSLVRVPGMEESGLRVYVKDLGNLLSFLGTAKGTDVEVLETDRAFFLRRPDGAVFGETLYNHSFPPVNVDWDLVDDETWEVPQEDLLAAIKFLQSGAKLDEPRVRFHREGESLTLSMVSVSGKPLPLTLTLTSVVQKDGAKGVPDFSVTDVYLGKMLNGNVNPKIKLGVTKKSAGGWVRIMDDRGPDTYLTTLAWLKTA